MAAARRGKGRKLGLALASGGMLGGVYELGALRALEESIQGLDLNRLDVYVGVSAGAFVGAHIANGITVAEMLRSLRAGSGEDNLFDPSIFFQPALAELRKSGLHLPWTIAEAFRQFLNRPDTASLLSPLSSLGLSLPICVFANEPIRAYLHQIFSMPGRTDDFRDLPRKFFVVATDLETGGPVLFGRGGLDQVPISRAVQASAAVPGLYRPVEVEGRVCVDGVLLKTLHSSVALGQGADLVFCVNPLVPINTGSAEARESLGTGAVTKGGLPAVLAQSFRILIHSRLVLGMERYAHTFPGADLVLLEPSPTEHRLFTNVFRFHSSTTVCEIGYEQTRMDLWNRRAALGPVLARHGLALRTGLLADPAHSVWDCLELPAERAASVTARLDATLRVLEAGFR
jgi:predicted acylesterase/phospholipase RssA